MTNPKNLVQRRCDNPRPVADVKAAMVEAMQPAQDARVRRIVEALAAGLEAPELLSVLREVGLPAVSAQPFCVQIHSPSGCSWCWCWGAGGWHDYDNPSKSHAEMARQVVPKQCAPAPVSDYDDLVARVKIALDDHSDPAVLAKVLFGLGINEARLSETGQSILVGRKLVASRYKHGWLDPYAASSCHASVAAAIVEAHRQPVELTPAKIESALERIGKVIR